MREESGKNTAVPLEIQNPVVAPAIIKTGTMVKNIEAAQNILPFPMITDFPLTVSVFLSSFFSLSCIKNSMHATQGIPLPSPYGALSINAIRLQRSVRCSHTY